MADAEGSLRGVLTAYVLVFIHLGSRKVYRSSATYHPDGHNRALRSSRIGILLPKTKLEFLSIPFLNKPHSLTFGRAFCSTATRRYSSLYSEAQPTFWDPPSPDFNPIENMWSKVKTHLRATKVRTQETLFTAIGSALKTITSKDAEGYFFS